MRNQTTTNILLTLVFLALVANLVAPLFKTADAVAVDYKNDSVPPAVQAEKVAQEIAPDKVAGQIADGLKLIADSNLQIAAAILEHAKSNDRISYSLDRVAIEMRSQKASE
ncbi:MAG: hypothetical protein Kow0099_00700 [Candidatus Abyssubacteria bacterium]